jgi:hypothetical protein
MDILFSFNEVFLKPMQLILLLLIFFIFFFGGGGLFVAFSLEVSLAFFTAFFTSSEALSVVSYVLFHPAKKPQGLGFSTVPISSSSMFAGFSLALASDSKTFDLVFLKLDIQSSALTGELISQRHRLCPFLPPMCRTSSIDQFLLLQCFGFYLFLGETFVFEFTLVLFFFLKFQIQTLTVFLPLYPPSDGSC